MTWRQKSNKSRQGAAIGARNRENQPDPPQSLVATPELDFARSQLVRNKIAAENFMGVRQKRFPGPNQCNPSSANRFEDPHGGREFQRQRLRELERRRWARKSQLGHTTRSGALVVLESHWSRLVSWSVSTLGHEVAHQTWQPLSFRHGLLVELIFSNPEWTTMNPRRRETMGAACAPGSDSVQSQRYFMTEHPPDSKAGEDSIREILADWALGAADGAIPQSSGPEDQFSWKNLNERGSPAAPELMADHSPVQSNALLADFELAVPGLDEISNKSERAMIEGEQARCPTTTHQQGKAVPLPRLVPKRSWPRPNDSVGGFHIILELGRGAFARVFLAAELNLGQRLVAIKVSQPDGDEPQILAQLQHTHIVPVHSVCDDRGTGLRILCMPYFGGANLAEVLAAAGGLEPTLRDGRSLVEALDHVGRSVSGVPSRASVPKPVSPPLSGGTSRTGSKTTSGFSSANPPERPATSSRFRSLLSRLIRPRSSPPGALGDGDAHPNQPFRQFLHGASAIQAAVWIMARLAEGLEHAHSRGLLHRDLKPANILLASDGTPMLLDFNLAARMLAEPIETEAHRAIIGGTLPYMSPEHVDAFNPHGATLPEAVDERSDIYAMGLILYEMLAGRRPFAEPPANVPLTQALAEMIAAHRHPPSLRRQPQSALEPRRARRQVPEL